MRITEAESRVMEALWRGSSLSAEQLIGDVRAGTAWGEATVRTLINRLLKKGAIGSDRIHGRHQYRAVVKRADYIETESENLLQRLFDGQVSPLIAYFAENRKLSPDDVKRLRALIAEIDDG